MTPIDKLGMGELVERLGAAIKLGTQTGARGKHPTNIYNVADEALTALTSLIAERAGLREALKPSAETKAAYIGEFIFPLAYTDDEGNHATTSVTVPWTTIKEIMAAISARAMGPKP